MGNIPYQCLYSRVDVVRGSDNYLLMEVELIEPSLYFNMDPKSPQIFAEVFNKCRKGRGAQALMKALRESATSRADLGQLLDDLACDNR